MKIDKLTREKHFVYITGAFYFYFDRRKMGEAPLTDAKYGRYIADVYATEDKSADILFNRVNSAE
ncbi:UNVERIFIED_CONTAM: hypothetical protein FOS11_27705, partial [Bacillus thuringiensis]